MKIANSVALLAGMAATSGILSAQTTSVDLRAQAKNIDFSAAVSSKPFKTGVTLPAACQTGETFFKTDAPAGLNLYACTASNTWTSMSSVTSTNSGPGAVELIKSQVGRTVTGRQLVTGEGTVITEQADTVTLETDTAITPRYSTASTAPTGTCQTARDQFIRVSGFPHFYGCVNGAWKPVYAVSATAPATCMVGELYFNSSDAGLFGCTAADTWVRFNASGVDLSVTGECYISYSCVLVPANTRTTLPAAAVAGRVVAIRIVLPNSIRLKTGLLYTNAGVTGTAFAAALYANAGGAPGAQIPGSHLRMDVTTAGYRLTPWGTGTVVLTPGIYWLGFSSEGASTEYQLAGATYGTIGTLLSQFTTNRAVVACANLAIGTGVTYTLPAECGTTSAPTSFTDAPIIVAAAQ